MSSPTRASNILTRSEAGEALAKAMEHGGLGHCHRLLLAYYVADQLTAAGLQLTAIPAPGSTESDAEVTQGEHLSIALRLYAFGLSGGYDPGRVMAAVRDLRDALGGIEACDEATKKLWRDATDEDIEALASLRREEAPNEQ